MDTKYSFDGPNGDDDKNIVYVRPVDISDLPEDVQEKTEGVEQLYAVHDSNGVRLALVANKQRAFRLARKNDLAPVNVH